MAGVGRLFGMTGLHRPLLPSRFAVSIPLGWPPMPFPIFLACKVP